MELISLDIKHQKLISLALKAGHPVALWRLPGQHTFNTLIDLSETDTTFDLRSMDHPPGFLLAPFYCNNDKGLFIKADIFLKGEQLSVNNSDDEKINQFLDYPADHEPTRPLSSGESTKSGDPDKHSFLNLIETEKRAIHQGFFHKLVAARSKKVNYTHPFDIYDNFKRLAEAYPSAMVFFVFHPEAGSWMGATPETLVEVTDNRWFRTVALAGTQKFDPSVPLSDVAWRQKEIEEQALVSRYIINCFKKIRVREFEENGPQTVRAGNLCHLQSEYIVDMQAIRYPEMAGIMLDLLHPTSAVCGMPKQEARDFILEHEGFDREYYSGFLGPVNLENNSHIFVNLRSMQLFEKHALLYAGAGITAHSDPEKEWLETEMKMNTLANVIAF